MDYDFYFIKVSQNSAILMILADLSERSRFDAGVHPADAESEGLVGDGGISAVTQYAAEFFLAREIQD